MAVVVDRKDVDKMLAYAAEENLEAVPVAEVTPEKRLVMYWRGKKIVDISRAFLDTNGAHQETDVHVNIPSRDGSCFNAPVVKDVRAKWLETMYVHRRDLSRCSTAQSVQARYSCLTAVSISSQRFRPWLRSFLSLRVRPIQSQ
jgi:phosphoribosylformylglycinamidine synthase